MKKTLKSWLAGSQPLAAALPLALCALAQPALAGPYSWACGNGSWDATCWSAIPGGLATLGQPGNGDIAYLLQSGASDRTVTFWNTVYPSAVLDSLWISGSGKGDMTLAMANNHPLKAAYVYVGINGGVGNIVQTAGTNTAGTEYIGYQAFGHYVQSGGTHTVTDSLFLGYGNGSLATYGLSGTGKLNAHDEYLRNAWFTQDGGTHQADQLIMGNNGGGDSVYTLNAGLLTVKNQIIEDAGPSASFYAMGGQHTVSGNLNLGSSQGTLGTYYLGGAGLTAGNQTIGGAGQGVFYNWGGYHAVTGDLGMGLSAGGSGTYFLDKGTLEVGGSIYTGSGVSKIQINGGTLINWGHVAVTNFELAAQAGSTASYTLNGPVSGSGWLAAETLGVGLSGNGTFTQLSGQNVVHQAAGFGLLRLGVEVGSQGTFNLSGGSLTVDREDIGFNGSGDFNQSGGTHAVLADLHLGFGSSGTVTQTGGIATVGGNLYIGTDAGASGVYKLGGGTLAVTGLVSGGSGSSTLIVDGGTLSAHYINVNHLWLGYSGFSNGSHIFSSGTLIADSELIGGLGSGAIHQSGGSHTVNAITMANWAGSSGAYTLAGGTLTVGSIQSGAGSSTLSLDGGSFAFATSVSVGQLNIGKAAGSSFALSLGSGQTLAAGTETLGGLGSGSVNQTGGSHTVGVMDIAKGAYTLSGGSLTVSTSLSNRDALNMGGGVVDGTGSFANLVGGRVRGYGTIATIVSNNSGLIEAKNGTLTLTRAMNNNAGGLVANGGSTLHFTGGLLGNSGTIQLAGGNLDNTGHALDNSGLIQMSAGNSTIQSAITSHDNGKITLADGGTATFYGTLDVQYGAELGVAAGSTASFLGPVFQRTGALFTGAGKKGYLGGFSVGDSPGFGVDSGSVTFGERNTYWAEIGGVTGCTAGCAVDEKGLKDSSYDVYEVAEQLTFGGTLRLVSWNGFVGQAGQKFDLFDWGSAKGKFVNIDSSGFLLAAGTQLDTSMLYVDGTISVAAVPEPDTYALLLAGIGILGAVARRRRSAAACR